MAKIMNDGDPVVPLERNLYGHPLADLLCERLFEQVLSELKLEKVPNWEMPIKVHRQQGPFSSKYVERHQNEWKEAEYGAQVEES